MQHALRCTLWDEPLLQPNRAIPTLIDISNSGRSAVIKVHCLIIQYGHFWTCRDEVGYVRLCLILYSTEAHHREPSPTSR